MKCSHFDHAYAYTYTCTCTYKIYRMHMFINFSTPVSIVELLYRIENDKKSIVGQKLKVICIFYCFLFSAGIYVIQSLKVNCSIAPKYVAVLAASSRGVYGTPCGVWW